MTAIQSPQKSVKTPARCGMVPLPRVSTLEDALWSYFLFVLTSAWVRLIEILIYAAYFSIELELFSGGAIFWLAISAWILQFAYLDRDWCSAWLSTINLVTVPIVAFFLIAHYDLKIPSSRIMSRYCIPLLPPILIVLAIDVLAYLLVVWFVVGPENPENSTPRGMKISAVPEMKSMKMEIV